MSYSGLRTVDLATARAIGNRKENGIRHHYRGAHPGMQLIVIDARDTASIEPLGDLLPPG